MEVRPGYKQTEVGVIPEDWKIKPLVDLAEVRSGIAKNSNNAVVNPVLVHYLRVANVQDRFLALSEMSKIRVSRSDVSRYAVLPGDVLMNEGGDLDKLGRGCMWHGEFTPCVHQNHVFVVRCGSMLSPNYLTVWTGSVPARRYFMFAGTQTTNLASINKTALGQLPVVLPPLAEQEAIAEAFSEADALIESLEQLLAKKHRLRQGAMHQLLTGKKRLPGFSGEWEVRRIAEIASPSSEKNSAGEHLTVLTCSKHLGFVDSLGYFENQIFSRDTSGYKVVKRGQIGYPANHVEEGSIGLQDLYDVALVSPIYVVFSVAEDVDSYFLHRLLKLDFYRQKFATATASSVDRRGSLRWPAFSEITVRLPSMEEQTAIANILRDMDAEVGGLSAKLSKARRIKDGMAKELLTGRFRLV